MKRLFDTVVNKLIDAIRHGNLEPSEGGRLGLLRGISDFDGLAEDEELCDMAFDADKYYSNDF